MIDSIEELLEEKKIDVWWDFVRLQFLQEEFSTVFSFNRIPSSVVKSFLKIASDYKVVNRVLKNCQELQEEKKEWSEEDRKIDHYRRLFKKRKEPHWHWQVVHYRPAD